MWLTHCGVEDFHSKRVKNINLALSHYMHACKNFSLTLSRNRYSLNSSINFDPPDLPRHGLTLGSQKVPYGGGGDSKFQGCIYKCRKAGSDFQTYLQLIMDEIMYLGSICKCRKWGSQAQPQLNVQRPKIVLCTLRCGCDPLLQRL